MVQSCGGVLKWPDNETLCPVIIENNSSSGESSLETSGDADGISGQRFAELYLISLFCLVGLIGNTVSISVLRQDKERLEAMFLLQILTVADSMYLVVSILRYPLKYLVADKTQYVYLQPYVFPLLKTCQTICIWMMVLVTTERYIYVCKPLQAPRLFHKKARRVLAVMVFVVGILYNIPRFLESCTFTFHNGCTNTLTVTMIYRPAFRGTLYFNIYKSAMYIICIYFLPLATPCAMNVQLIQAIHRSRKRHREITRSGAANQAVHETNATLVLVVIIVVFLLCESPELVLQVLTVIHRHISAIPIFSGEYPVLLDLVIDSSEVLMVVNSSTNFFIYLLLSKRFRATLKEIFVTKFYSTETHESVPLQRQRKTITDDINTQT